MLFRSNYTTALRAVREARSPASFIAGSPGRDKYLALREDLFRAAHEGRLVTVLDPKRIEERAGRREVIVEPFRSGYRFQVGLWEGGRPRPRQEGVLMFDEAYVMVSSERDRGRGSGAGPRVQPGVSRVNPNLDQHRRPL